MNDPNFKLLYFYIKLVYELFLLDIDPKTTSSICSLIFLQLLINNTTLKICKFIFKMAYKIKKVAMDYGFP